MSSGQANYFVSIGGAGNRFPKSQTNERQRLVYETRIRKHALIQ
jgi:hypothetical protein